MIDIFLAALPLAIGHRRGELDQAHHGMADQVRVDILIQFPIEAGVLQPRDKTGGEAAAEFFRAGIRDWMAVRLLRIYSSKLSTSGIRAWT